MPATGAAAPAILVSTRLKSSGGNFAMRVECQEMEQYFSDYLENSLEGENLHLLSQHLRECQPCHELLNEMKSTLLLCEQMPELEPPDRLIKQILAQTIGPMESFSLLDYLKDIFRPVYTSPRFATGTFLAAISLGIVLNSLGVNWSSLGQLSLSSLTPQAMFQNFQHTVNVAYDNGVRRINDLKVLYEIQLKIDEFRSQTAQSPGSSGQKPAARSEEKPQNSSSSSEFLSASNQSETSVLNLPKGCS
jgi:hypothetical protein